MVWVLVAGPTRVILLSQICNRHPGELPLDEKQFFRLLLWRWRCMKGFTFDRQSMLMIRLHKTLSRNRHHKPQNELFILIRIASNDLHPVRDFSSCLGPVNGTSNLGLPFPVAFCDSEFEVEKMARLVTRAIVMKLLQMAWNLDCKLMSHDMHPSRSPGRTRGRMMFVNGRQA